MGLVGFILFCILAQLAVIVGGCVFLCFYLKLVMKVIDKFGTIGIICCFSSLLIIFAVTVVCIKVFI